MVEICRCAKALFERVVDVLDAHAEPRRRLPVDRDVGLQAALLAVRGDVDEPGDLAQPLHDLRHPGVERRRTRGSRR